MIIYQYESEKDISQVDSIISFTKKLPAIKLKSIETDKNI